MNIGASIRSAARALFSNLTTRDQPRGASGFFRRTPAGIYVDEDTALSFSGYFACIRVISEDIAGFPWQVIRRDGETRTVLHESRIGRLLRVRPNPEQTAVVFRQALMASALGWGNGYAEIARDMSGRPAALWFLHPSRVTPDRTATGELFYRIRNTSGGDTLLAPSDIIHVMGPSDDGMVGLSIAGLARNTIALGLAAESFGSTFFGNGAHPGGVLKHPRGLTPRARDNMRDSWNALHQGPTAGQKVAILEEGTEYQAIGIPPEDAQFLETRNFQIEDVVRWFRVPPHKIQHLLRATFNNIEQLNLNYLSDALLPWVVRLEQEVDAKLVTQPNTFSKLDLRSLMRADSETRANFYHKMFQLGMSINEIRALEDMDPVDDGDARFVPVNVQTVGRAVQMPEPVAPVVPVAPESGTEPPADDPALQAMINVVIDRAHKRVEHRAARAGVGDEFWVQHRDYAHRELSAVCEAFMAPWLADTVADQYITAERSGLAYRFQMDEFLEEGNNV